MKNFLPKEYKKNRKLKINHSYLVEQFADYTKIFKEVEKVVKKGDYTLGKEVDVCEKNFAKRTGAKYAISVGNGTDALLLTLKALNIGSGDEVITVPYTFIATVGSIVTAGAKPVFVDIKEDYNMDENKIATAITKKTKAIMPVHWAGRPCELDKIYSIAKKYKLHVVQDSAHVIGARFKKKHLINFGDACTYSMHPLKNLNVWGDGGFIVTNKKPLAKKLYLIRNHGLKNRNSIEIFGYNSRLDTIQAAVLNIKLKNYKKVIRIRNELAQIYFDELQNLKQVKLFKLKNSNTYAFHQFVIRTSKRDQLAKYLKKNKIQTMVHYPYMLNEIRFFPKSKNLIKSKNLGKKILSLPISEEHSKKDIKYIAKKINFFFNS